MDRAIIKLLSLPFFDDQFANVLMLLQLCTVEKFVCLRAKTAQEFENKLAAIAPAMIARTSGVALEADLQLVVTHFEQLSLLC